MLVRRSLNYLLFTPKIDTIVAMQRDDTRSWQLRLLGDQKIGRHAQIWRCLEAQILFDVIAAIRLPDRSRLRSDSRWRVREKLEELHPCPDLPLLQAFEFGAQEGK